MMYNKRRDQCGWNGCCSAMWETHGKKLQFYYFTFVLCFQEQRYVLDHVLDGSFGDKTTWK